MRLVYKFITKQHNEEFSRLCEVSKNLYNQALYEIKTALKEENKFLFYNDLDKLMKEKQNLNGKINYKLLKAQISQQILKVLDKSVKSYVKSVKDWGKHKEKYKGMPKLPNYKGKDSKHLLIYTNQCCSISEDGHLKLSKNIKIRIPQFEKYSNKLKEFQQVRVIPRINGTFEIEIVYLAKDVELNKNKGIASIDFGVDNLVTMITDFGNPMIYSGKQIKSKNQYFNKKLAKLKSLAETNNKKKTTKKIQELYSKREQELNDLYHKVSRNIVNYLNDNKVGKLICGLNKGWKDSIHIGKQSNQTFVQISYDKLIEFLRYKCEMCGIEFVLNEESYTSKCDGLATEEIGKHEIYLGKRVKRWLFKSSVGRLINADVNGALNIMRKVVGDFEITSKIINSGWLFQPIKFNNLYMLQSIKVYK